MTPSIRHDPERLSDLIGLVYDSAMEEQQWTLLARRLTELFPGTQSMVLSHDGTRFHTVHSFANGGPGPFAELQTDVDVVDMNGLNICTSLLTLPNGFVARTSKYVDPDHLAGTQFYLQTLKPAALREFIVLKLSTNQSRMANIAVCLPDDPAGGTAMERELFELLLLLSPHAVRAFHLARSVALARHAANALGGFLDAIVLPMLVTNARGGFVFANSAGRRLLERGDLCRINAAGQVALRDAGATAQLHRRIAGMAGEEANRGMRIEHGDDHVSLCIAPFRPSMQEVGRLDRDLLGEDRLFAVFIGQSQRDAVSPALLSDVFDLTAREAEVCRDLMAGSSPAEIAEASGRSLKTVRNQIQAVHDKLDVTSTGALIEALSVFRTAGAMFEEDSAPRAPVRLDRLIMSGD